MKTKKIDKKLSLNKNTVVDLSLKHMNEAKGGKVDTECTFCYYTCTGGPCTRIYCDTVIMSTCA